MSFINNLIRRAKDRPKELVIPPNRVRALAEHVRGCNCLPLPADKIEHSIIAGELRLLDVPVRVASAA